METHVDGIFVEQEYFSWKALKSSVKSSMMIMVGGLNFGKCSE